MNKNLLVRWVVKSGCGGTEDHGRNHYYPYGLEHNNYNMGYKDYEALIKLKYLNYEKNINSYNSDSNFM